MHLPQEVTHWEEKSKQYVTDAVSVCMCVSPVPCGTSHNLITYSPIRLAHMYRARISLGSELAVPRAQAVPSGSPP